MNWKMEAHLLTAHNLHSVTDSTIQRQSHNGVLCYLLTTFHHTYILGGKRRAQGYSSGHIYCSGVLMLLYFLHFFNIANQKVVKVKTVWKKSRLFHICHPRCQLKILTMSSLGHPFLLDTREAMRMTRMTTCRKKTRSVTQRFEVFPLCSSQFSKPFSFAQ